jgi:hypothetical protein
MTPATCVCSPSIDCDTVGCNYQEPHYHGFACDNGCAYCHGKRVPVMDPENHPNHIEFKRDTSVWPGKAG